MTVASLAIRLPFPVTAAGVNGKLAHRFRGCQHQKTAHCKTGTSIYIENSSVHNHNKSFFCIPGKQPKRSYPWLCYTSSACNIILPTNLPACHLLRVSYQSRCNRPVVLCRNEVGVLRSRQVLPVSLYQFTAQHVYLLP